MTDFRESTKLTPMVINHWEYKFERAVKILTKGGYTPDELIEKIRQITKTSVPNEHHE